MLNELDGKERTFEGEQEWLEKLYICIPALFPV